MKWPEKKTRMTRLDEGTINRVQMFYCRDYISRMAPGDRDVVTDCANGNYQRKTPEAAHGDEYQGGACFLPGGEH